MTPTEDQVLDERPDAARVRAALARMLASEPFRGSAQLGAFLRFIVEETLAGNADRIKGYAIAVEALGRDTSFDPTLDPIVRVEANRLRRAIDTYYAGPGQDDPVFIDLKRGSYVPSFRLREVAPRPAELPPQVSLRDRITESLGMRWRLALFVTAIAAVVSVGLDLAGKLIGRIGESIPAVVDSAPVPAAEAPGKPGLPILYVELFDTDGSGPTTMTLPERLRARLQDALSHFEEIEVVVAPPDAARGNTRGLYRMAGTVTFAGEEPAQVTVRLIEADRGTLVWSRTYDDVHETAEADPIKRDTLRQIVTALAQPNGIIQARERQRRAAGGAMEARYRCLLDAFDYLRTYDRSAHAPVRSCLEQAVVNDPNFALGYMLLAEVYTREYFSDIDAEAENPALDRALRTAQRALELAPESARAHLVLMAAHFARREFGAALQAGERALALNPDGMHVLADYGYMLIFLGELEKGTAALQKAVEAGAHLMYRTQHALFISAYLNGDMDAANIHANAIATDSFPLGLTAKALAAAKSGDARRARQIVDRLAVLQPSWARDPHSELRKVFRKPADVERFAADLAAIGLGATN
jgi:Tfp pilus assembly protein PilF